MSIKQRMNWLEGMRVDKPHLKAIDDSVIFDFKTLIQSLADKPYILRGFDIDNSGSAISGSASNIQVKVDSAVVWMPDQPEGSYLRVPAGTPNEILSPSNPKVIGSFTANSINYVSIRFKRATDSSTNDIVAFWDVDAKVEFTKTVPLGLVLDYNFLINTTGFNATDASLAIITTDASNNVIKIENAKNSLFRLGKGGITPDSSYNWTYTLSTENPLALTSSGGPDPFTGGDWEIKTMKEWMDAIMTEIKGMKGSAYWYSNGSSLIPSVNLSNIWSDALGSTITGIGKFVHSDTTPGLLSWTSTLYIRSIIGNLTYQINPGSVTLNQGQVAYIQLVRNQDFQPANIFTFTNGSTTVLSSIAITGISAGDWIKFEAHDVSKWAKIASVSGTTITLTAPYLGASAIGKAVRAQGTYTVSVANPEAVPVSADIYWLAKRDDNAVAAATIETPANSGATRASNIATITTTSPHGLSAGQTVSISGVSVPSFNNVVEIIDTPTPTTFRYYNPGPDVSSGIAGNGSVSIRARIYLRAIGELVQGEERQFDDNAVLNVLTFIGSESETDITPPYTILPNALSPYTFSTNNNLTEAISAITGNLNTIFTTLDQPSYDETIEIVASPTPTAFITQSTGGSDESIQSATERIGQSFVATTDSFLTRVDLSLKAFGAPDATIHCDIYDNNAGEPGNLLGTSINTVFASSLTGSYTIYQFNLPPIPVVASSIYWIVLRVSGVVTLSLTDYIQAQISTANPYSGGNLSKYNGSSWTASPSSDLVFTAYNVILPANQWPPIPANSLITIPKNSRLPGFPQQNYVVGKGTLELYLNGQFLRLNAINSWQEVGSSLSNSSVVKILQNLEPGDELTFRLDATGGPGSGGAGAPDDNFVTLPTEPTADNADYMLIYDVSANAYKKQTRASFLAGLSRIRTVNTFNSNATLTSSHDHVRVDCSSGPVTLTLPLAASNIGLQYTIKKIDNTSNAVNINPGTDVIDGASILTFNTPNQSFTIIAATPGVWEIV